MRNVTWKIFSIEIEQQQQQQQQSKRNKNKKHKKKKVESVQNVHSSDSGNFSYSPKTDIQTVPAIGEEMKGENGDSGK